MKHRKICALIFACVLSAMALSACRGQDLPANGQIRGEAVGELGTPDIYPEGAAPADHANRPPQLLLEITDGDVSSAVAVRAGAYEWHTFGLFGTGTGEIACGMHPLEYDVEAQTLSKGASVRLTASGGTLVSLRRWEAGKTESETLLQNAALKKNLSLAQEDGVEYVYEAKVSFGKNREASYVFRLLTK